MRGAALARANVLHFGQPRNNAALKLAQGEDLPQWVADGGGAFRLGDAKRHIEMLLRD